MKEKMFHRRAVRTRSIPLLVLVALFFISCGPTVWGTYPTPPPHQKMSSGELGEELKTLLTDKEKNRRIEEFNAQRFRSFQKQSQKEVTLVCVEEGRWVIVEINEEKSQAAAKPMPMFGSDSGLDIKQTISFVVKKVDEINVLFEELTELRRLVAAKPDDSTFSNLAISQGVVVLYECRVLLDVLDEIKKEGGSFEPLEEYVEFTQDIINEVADVLLPSLLDNAVKYGMPDKDVIHYRIQIAVLKGASPKEYCEQVDFAGEEHMAQALGWCAYDAEKRGNVSEAVAYYEKAKMSLLDVEVPSYAVRKLRKIKKGH